MEAAEANAPMDRTDAYEPIEPTEKAEPTDPIDSTEFFDHRHRTEFSDPIDHLELRFPVMKTILAAQTIADEVLFPAARRSAGRRTGRSVRRDQHAQRLVREAMFLLVFGSRPAIRDDLLSRFADRRGPDAAG